MDFFIFALLSFLGISIAAGPVGSLVVWSRLIYFSDSLIHNVFLGIALACFLNINTMFAIVFVSAVFSVLFYNFRFHKKIYSDALLTVMISVATSLGLIFFPRSIDVVTPLLFGDVLAVSYIDMFIIYCVAFLILVVTKIRWKRWLLLSIDRDISAVENMRVKDIEIMMLVSTFIAISINIIGMFMVSVVLVAPAFCAGLISKSPKIMMLNASFLCFQFMLIGFFFSYVFDIPVGPSAAMIGGITLFFCFQKQKQRSSGNARKNI